jgi:hypothetical protein
MVKLPKTNDKNLLKSMMKLDWICLVLCRNVFMELSSSIRSQIQYRSAAVHSRNSTIIVQIDFQKNYPLQKIFTNFYYPVEYYT